MTAGTGHDANDPPHAQPDPHPIGTDHDEHEPSLRERLLNVSTMDGRFRTLTAIVIAQVAATSLLVLLPKNLFGEITINILGVGQAAIGRVHYAFSVFFLLAGLTLFVAGLGRADPRGTATLLALFFLLYLLDLLVVRLPLNTSITIFVTIILMFVACAMTAFLIRRMLRTKSATAEPAAALMWFFVIFYCFLPAMALYAVVSVPAFFYSILSIVGTPFILLYPFAAIDWAEIVDGFVKSVERSLRLQERNGLLIIFSAVAIVLPMWFTARAFAQDAAATGPRLLATSGFAAALALLLWIARFRGDWPVRFAWAPTALMVAVVIILANGGGLFVDQRLVAFFIAGLMSVALCVCGRNPQWQSLAPTALLGTLIGFTASYFALFSEYGDIENLIVMGAVVASVLAVVAVVVTVGWTRIRTEGIAALRYPIQTIVTLNGSLVAVYGLAVAYSLMLGNSDRQVVEALVIAVALLSEVALSGHSVTNIHSDWFPRNSRLLLFFGFVIFTLAYTLTNVALHGEGEPLHAFKLFNNPETAVYIGLLLMGPAALWALFILRTGQWLAGQQPKLRANPHAAAQPLNQQA